MRTTFGPGPSAARPAAVAVIALAASVALAAGLAASIGSEWVPPAEAQTTCPNAAIRAAQGSQHLPDCRAYERVSPAEKGGLDVLGETQRPYTVTAPDGAAIIYGSSAAFGDAVGASFPSIYRAVRGPDGWRTGAVSPPQSASVIQGATSSVEAFTDGLTHAIVRTNLALAPGAPDGTANLFVRDNRSGTYELLTPGGPTTPSLLNPTPWFDWATPSFSSVVFSSAHPLTDDAPVDPAEKVYVAHDGEVELASILPGDVPTTALPGDPNHTGAGGGTDGAQGAISDDGQRVFFGVLPNPNARPTGLYMRDLETDTTTEIVPAANDSVRFAAASGDGERVLFKMTDPDNNSATYVLHDVGGGESTLLEAYDGSGVEAETTLAVSDDLDSVYLLAGRTLLSDQDPVPGGAYGMYRWQPLDDELTHVANLESVLASDSIKYPGGRHLHPAEPARPRADAGGRSARLCHHQRGQAGRWDRL